MPQSASQGSLVARLFIILTALGIVVLGVYPMRADIRDAAEKSKLWLKKNLPILTAEAPGKRPAAKTKSDEPVLASTGEPPEPKKPAGIVIEDPAKSRKLDRLSPNDRKELSDLVNSF